jgi:GNAT superfamily N-acetyltransferase
MIEKIPKNSAGDLESRAAAIASLASEIWREHYTPIIGAAQVEYMLAKYQSAEQIYRDITENGYTYFTAKDIGILTGYCAVHPQDDALLLSKLYVRSNYRGKGLARAFLNEAAALCGEHGKIRLTVNKYNHGAIAAYHKMGFETVDSVKVDIGGGFFMDDYVMELSVNCCSTLLATSPATAVPLPPFSTTTTKANGKPSLRIYPVNQA